MTILERRKSHNRHLYCIYCDLPRLRVAVVPSGVESASYVSCHNALAAAEAAGAYLLPVDLKME